MDRKALLREYKSTHCKMGVFQIRNRINGKMLIGSSRNLPGILNRYRFTLKMGTCPVKALQEEWSVFGPDAFEFNMLDELPPFDEPDYDPENDLQLLESLWREKLSPNGDNGYIKK